MAEPFHARFNIDLPIDEAQRRFINRIQNQIRKILRYIYLQSPGHSYFDGIMIGVEIVLGEEHKESSTSPASFAKVMTQHIGGDFVRALHFVEGFYSAIQVKIECVPIFDRAVADTIAQSEVDLGISWQNGVFSKKGAELLDNQLVNEPLRCLAEPKYGTVHGPFQKGLSHLLEGTKDTQRLGDSVTDMYEALEAIAKIVTGKPIKELSGLRDEFIAKLRLPDTHKRMLKEYIDYGCEFRHALEAGETRRWPLEHEAEHFVYMTGMFIRLAIQART